VLAGASEDTIVPPARRTKAVDNIPVGRYTWDGHVNGPANFPGLAIRLE
jgi:hypothetical protein